MTGITTLLLDLDDTLHDASAHVMPYLNQRMAEYIADKLRLSVEEGDNLGRHYFKLYGATAKGLVDHHPEITIEHFLETTHDLSPLINHVTPMPGAREVLNTTLPTYIISNGPRDYVRKILEIANLIDFCQDVFGLEDMNFMAKPHEEAFQRILTRVNKQPAECLLLDDVAVNVASARKLGIEAIWFNPQHKNSDHDVPMIHHLSELAELIQQPSVQ